MTDATEQRQGTRLCPHCGKPLLSPSAARILAFIRENCPARGGYMFESARPAYEAGTYHDANLAELLAVGAIAPHSDPAKGWVPVW